MSFVPAPLAEIARAADGLATVSWDETTEPGACGGDPDQRADRRDADGRRVGHGCPDPACAHDGRDPRESGARLGRAGRCRRLQGSDELPHAHGTTARITVTIGYADLLDRLRSVGLLPGGGSLSAAAVRRLACDAEIVPAHQTPWRVQLDPTTRRPVWTPPAAVDDRARFTHHPPRPPSRPRPGRAPRRAA